MPDSGVASPETIPPETVPPLVVDLMCGPKAPITKAFLFCGWRSVNHDLSSPVCQELVKNYVAEAVLVVGALDCSTKSRAREIQSCPSHFVASNMQWGCLGWASRTSAGFPRTMWLATLFSTRCRQWSIEAVAPSVKNPARSLHWHIPREVEMEQSGQWTDTFYDACGFMGARHKRQRLRHNLFEVAQWPPLTTSTIPGVATLGIRRAHDFPIQGGG